jgi:hypothetical protein
MQNYSGTFNRRRVCCSIVGLAINGVLANLPLGTEQKPQMAGLGQEFVIVNGWVLTREDVAPMLFG